MKNYDGLDRRCKSCKNNLNKLAKVSKAKNSKSKSKSDNDLVSDNESDNDLDFESDNDLILENKPDNELESESTDKSNLKNLLKQGLIMEKLVNSVIKETNNYLKLNKVVKSNIPNLTKSITEINFRNKLESNNGDLVCTEIDLSNRFNDVIIQCSNNHPLNAIILNML